MSDQTHARSSYTHWPVSTAGISNKPDFLVCFHGLFAFTYNRETGICEVGANARADHHKFRMYVLEIEGLDHNLLYSFTPDYHSDVDGPIVLRVKNPTSKGVGIHKSEADPYSDWSRMPDLEGPIFHNQRVEKKRSALKPRLEIHNGVFFTALTTAPYTFARVEENRPDDSHEPIELGPIAFLPAVELAHGDQGYVSLAFENKELRLARSEGKLYVILFGNSCPKDVCTYDPKSKDKEERNDFYMYYRMFKKPGGHPQYGIMLSGDDADEREDPRTIFFNKLIGELQRKSVIVSSKDSPCGGAGFGESMGLDW